MPDLRLNRSGLGWSGTSDPTPTTTPGTPVLPDTALMSARSSNELYITARTPLKTGPKIARPMTGSRSAVGTSTARRDTARMPW